MTKPIDILRRAPIVPLIQAETPEDAVKTSGALASGGLRVQEVVFRTEAALESLSQIARTQPDVLVGAGTVLSLKQAEDAFAAGARFLVSPGLNPDVVAFAQANALPIFPGIVSPTELQMAWNLGLRTVKFFPAGLSGGPRMLKALSSVFRDVEFMPTGGINAGNLKEYLAIPSVLACGGSWLTPKEAVQNQEYSIITGLARQALSIAEEIK